MKSDNKGMKINQKSIKKWIEKQFKIEKSIKMNSSFKKKEISIQFSTDWIFFVYLSPAANRRRKREVTWSAGKMLPAYWTAIWRRRCSGDSSETANSASSSAPLDAGRFLKAGNMVDRASWTAILVSGSSCQFEYFLKLTLFKSNRMNNKKWTTSKLPLPWRWTAFEWWPYLW